MKRTRSFRRLRENLGGKAENARAVVLRAPRAAQTAQILGDGEPRLKPVLVEARAEMRPAEPCSAQPLQRP